MLNFLSAFPVIVILIYMYYRDKYEKEPLKTLAKAFLGGVLALILTIITVNPLESILPQFHNSIVKAMIDSFLLAGIPEEIFKFLFLYLFIWKDRNFNEKYDGIIYAVYVSMGFALIENFGYVYKLGVNAGILRCFTAVPGHALDGIIMGYYFSLAKFDVNNRKKYLQQSLGYAILAHGVYDFLIMYMRSSLDSNIIIFLIIAFFVFLYKLYRIGFKKIKEHVDASCFKK